MPPYSINPTAIAPIQVNVPQPRYVHQNSDRLARLLSRAKRRV